MRRCSRYEESERVIQRLLGVERELVPVETLGVEAQADWDHLQTPETYLGYWRSEQFASPDGASFDERRAYELPERLLVNHWALAGEWTLGPRTSSLIRPAGASPIVSTRATRTSCWLEDRESRSPFVCSSTASLQAHHTASTSTRTGAGCSGKVASTSLAREHGTVRERTLQITFAEPGAEAYAFTFG